MRTWPFWCALCCCVAGTAAWALERLTEIDLIDNGGFEREGSPGQPAGWNARRAPPDGVSLSWTGSGARTGNRCLSITSTQNGDRPWFWWEQSLALQGNVAYRLTAWVRADSLQRGALFVVSCQDASGKEVLRRHLASVSGQSSEWRMVTGSVTPPAAVRRGRIQFSMHGTGRVWLDDVCLRRSLDTRQLSYGAARTYPVLRGVERVTVDGQTREWADLPRATIPRAYDVSHAEAIVMDQEDSHGSSDLSFAFALQATQTHLHLLVEVTDDIRATRRPYWQGDSIQFALDTRYGRSADGYGPGVLALGIALDDGKARALIEHVPDGASLVQEKVLVAAGMSEGGYAVEVALPWADIDCQPMQPGQRLGFTIAVNDCDGKGRKWAQWTPGIAKRKCPAEYGTLVFPGDSDLALLLVPVVDRAPDTRPLVFELDVLSLRGHPRSGNAGLEIPARRH